jgi:hypothetical protein
MYLARSLQKFNEGLRTKMKITVGNRTWTDGYLQSSYHGAFFSVITTKTEQFLFLTDECEQAEWMKQSHVKNWNWFGSIIEPKTEVAS